MTSFSAPFQIQEFARRRAIAQERLEQAALLQFESIAASAFNKLAIAIGIEVEKWLYKLADAMNDTHRETLNRNLHELGHNAQLSMLAAYRELVTARESPADSTHYRAGMGRLAGGILLQALSRDDFFEVSGTTLIWGNLDALDASARHWHRVAAGAGGRGSGINDEKPVTFQDHVLAVIGYSTPPSPGFFMPAGVWVTPGGHQRVRSGGRVPGTDEFYPQNTGAEDFSVHEVRRGVFALHPNLNAYEAGVRVPGRRTQGRPTRGIRSHDFFRAGINTLAEDLPVILQQYVYDLLGEWADAARLDETVRVTASSSGLGVSGNRR